MLLNIILSILSSVLLILCFPKVDFGFLAWIALVPWFLSLRRQKPKNAFLLSYLAGLVFFSGTLYWVNYVTSLGFSILVFSLAFYFGIFGLVFSIKYKHSNIAFLISISSFWVVLEYIRSHLFTGFSWALLGYSQYLNLPVIQFSDITGAYGVSFLLVLVNVGIFQVIDNYHKKVLIKKVLFICLSTLILTLTYGYCKLHQPLNGQKVKIATVQGNIPQKMKWDPQARDYILEQYTFLTEMVSFDDPDLIIWPETSVPGFLEEDLDLLDEIISLSQDIYPTYLLVGNPFVEGRSSLYNNATLLLDDNLIRRYSKVHLVPFGEFMPLPWIFSYFPSSNLIGNFTHGDEYTVFSLSREHQELKFSVLICFEDIFGHLARRFTRGGARFLVNMTNDAWFENSSEPHQHLQASVFRAVENRVNLVRSANTGVSCFIDPKGNIISRVSDDSGCEVMVEGIGSEELEIAPFFSFYTVFGDIFAWLCIVSICLLFLPNKPH